MTSFLDKKDPINNHKLLECSNYSSVIVRVLDGNRIGHLRKAFDTKRLDYKYIPEKHLYQYAYNEIVAED